MASPARIAVVTRPRERRTQAERRATTRARIVQATRASLADVGFQRTTAAEIARRAGVTWGAVQHHFGGKEGILHAALEASFDGFANAVDDLPTRAADLDARIDRFVDQAWAHFGSADFRSTFEILLHHLPAEAQGPVPTLQQQMGQAWDRLWTHVFDGMRVPARQRRELERYTFSVLSGLAFAAILRGGAPTRSEAGKRFLKETLRDELGRWAT